ncbi:MAG TPA: serine hydrolase [Variovorax sp.]|nr:serine hydrolase [Variovorax sp.]
MHSRICILGATLACAASTALAQAPQLPPPDAVSLDRLGYMSSLPPTGEQIVGQGNRTRYPQMRWVLQHTREVVPTRNVRRGALAPAPLQVAAPGLGELAFEDDKGKPLTLEQWQESTYTDALVVLHRGRVVYERYRNQMRPETPHLLFSITKSFTGLIAAQLAHEGQIDPQALVTRYVPELADSAWGDMKVRDVMDMTGAVRFREVYTDPTSDIFPYLYASTMVPPPAGHAGPTSIYEFLKTLKKEGEHGSGFVYRTVHSEVLGWILSRATGKHYADLLSERVWSRLGAQEDAYLMVDPVGTPLQGAGLNATARDLARFGEMLRRGGELNGQRVFDRAVIDDLRRGGDREKFKASGMTFRPGYSYRNQWWVLHNADGAFEASGVHGQMLHVNPAAEMVVVKLGSHPVAGAGLTHPVTLRAWDALAGAVRRLD